MIKSEILLLALALSTIGCGNSENTDPAITDNVSNGRDWLLVSYGVEAGDSVLVIDSVPFTLKYNFTSDDQIMGFTGFDGCNVFSSTDVILEGENVIPVNGVNVDDGYCENLQFTEYL